MKKIIVLSLVSLFFLNGYAQKENEKVQIESNGTWYPGKILKVNDEEKLYFVKYDGCVSSPGIGLFKSRIKPIILNRQL